MMGGQVPILVLKEGTTRETGKDALERNIMAATAVADAVKSTLGPKGMDKMLVDSLGDVTITNDGVTILKEIDVVHPAAKMVIEVAKTLDEECGDGTTTAVIIAGDLLKQARELVSQNIHPTVISGGYHMASEKATEILESIAQKIEPDDETVLTAVAETAMTGKNVDAVKETLAKLVVKAVRSVAEQREGKYEVDLDDIKVEKKHGASVTDSELIEGIILDKERVSPAMPGFVKGARIALVDAALEIKKTEVSASIKITSPDQLQSFLDEEAREVKGMVDKVLETGANVVICQKGIDDLAIHYLAKAGIYAVRRAKKSDMEMLAKATGGRIVSTLHDLSKEDLGKADAVEERKVAGDNMTFVTGCTGAKAVTLLLRGGTEHVVDEVERAVKDALSVVAVAMEDAQVAPGGGAPYMKVAQKLQEWAASVGGREQLAIEAFSRAMESIPRTLAENAGLDPIDTLIDLRSAHSKGNHDFGVNVFGGGVMDMTKARVLEPLRVEGQAIQSATDAATMILRIDDVIAAKASGDSGKGGKKKDFGSDED